MYDVTTGYKRYRYQTQGVHRDSTPRARTPLRSTSKLPNLARRRPVHVQVRWVFKKQCLGQWAAPWQKSCRHQRNGADVWKTTIIQCLSRLSRTACATLIAYCNFALQFNKKSLYLPEVVISASLTYLSFKFRCRDFLFRIYQVGKQSTRFTSQNVEFLSRLSLSLKAIALIHQRLSILFELNFTRATYQESSGANQYCDQVQSVHFTEYICFDSRL